MLEKLQHVCRLYPFSSSFFLFNHPVSYFFFLALSPPSSPLTAESRGPPTTPESKSILLRKRPGMGIQSPRRKGSDQISRRSGAIVLLPPPPPTPPIWLSSQVIKAYLSELAAVRLSSWMEECGTSSFPPPPPPLHADNRINSYVYYQA